MINDETPYKLAEIIRDTWPGIYLRPLTEKTKYPIIDEPTQIGMDDFFKDLSDRLQHVGQLSRKNAKTNADLQFAEGINHSQKIIRELREKYNI